MTCFLHHHLINIISNISIFMIHAALTFYLSIFKELIFMFHVIIVCYIFYSIHDFSKHQILIAYIIWITYLFKKISLQGSIISISQELFSKKLKLKNRWNFLFRIFLEFSISFSLSYLQVQYLLHKSFPLQ